MEHLISTTMQFFPMEAESSGLQPVQRNRIQTEILCPWLAPCWAHCCGRRGLSPRSCRPPAPAPTRAALTGPCEGVLQPLRASSNNPSRRHEPVPLPLTSRSSFSIHQERMWHQAVFLKWLWGFLFLAAGSSPTQNASQAEVIRDPRPAA